MTASSSGRRWRIVAACYLVRAVIASAAALPWALAVSARIGAYPGGDVVLWQDGGMLLVETGRLIRATVPSLALRSGTVAVVGLFVWLIPLGALISVTARPSSRPWRAVLRQYGSLALLQGGVMCVQLLLVACSWWLGSVLQRGAEAVRADVAVAAAAGVAALAWLGLALFHDVVRLALFRGASGVMRSLADSFGLPLRRWARLARAAMWRMLMASALVVLVAASLLLGPLDPGGVGAVLAVQLLALCFVLLRASWLARAAGICAPPPAIP